MVQDLLEKYNVPGPRYTSYPTVPYWDQKSFSKETWIDTIKKAFVQNGRELSLYLHLPFCERLCTYCGCNTHITINHDWEDVYIEALLKEWELYLNLLPEKPIIKELHLGGGTPTFFTPERLTFLLKNIFSGATVAKDASMGFEGHPLNTTYQHLEALGKLGFKRVSFGVQDFNPTVQKLINRVQTVAQVEDVTRWARELGYTSVNYDLVYGLPGQTIESVRDTVNEVIRLRPDRIAFYGYAHVPWIKPAQNKLTPHLPSSEVREALYKMSKDLFSYAGYEDIGMDHFALSNDTLFKSAQDGTLHRNFMGYTTSKTYFTLGLGMSAISDSWTAFAQNEKNLKKYIKMIQDGELPVIKGHILTEEDLQVRTHILNLMCRYQTSWTEEEHVFFGTGLNHTLLQELEDDGLIFYDEGSVRTTEAGKSFIRNICMAFDVRLWRDKPQGQIFSKTV